MTVAMLIDYDCERATTVEPAYSIFAQGETVMHVYAIATMVLAAFRGQFLLCILATLALVNIPKDQRAEVRMLESQVSQCRQRHKADLVEIDDLRRRLWGQQLKTKTERIKDQMR